MWACCLLSNFNLLALYCQNVFNSEVTGKNTYELNVVSTGTNTSNVLVIDRNEVQRVALISEGQDPKLSAPQKQRCALYSSLEHRNTYVGEKKKIKKNCRNVGPLYVYRVQINWLSSSSVRDESFTEVVEYPRDFDL